VSSAIQITAIATAIAVGCTPPVKQYDIRDETLSCADANRLAYETLTGMGFDVIALEPAMPGSEGVLKGERGPDGSKLQRVVAHVDCKNAVTAVDVREEGKVLGQLDFKRAFFISFDAVRTTARRRREMDEKMAAGTLPSSIQRRDVRIVLEPISGVGTKLDFGFDLYAAGVLPLRIDVDNLTERAYRVVPGDIRLTRIDRHQVFPLSLDDAAARIGKARDPGKGVPLTALDQTAIIEHLRKHLFAGGLLNSGEQAQGFLYFPAAHYKRGRVVVIDEESQETEGVVVEF